jgi:hypothetical protein
MINLIKDKMATQLHACILEARNMQAAKHANMCGDCKVCYFIPLSKNVMIAADIQYINENSISGWY